MKAGCGNYKHCPALTVMLYEAGNSTYEICNEFGIPWGSIDKLCKKGRLKIRKEPKYCRALAVMLYQLTEFGEVRISKVMGVSPSSVHRAITDSCIDLSVSKKCNQYGMPNGGRKRYDKAKSYKQRCLKYGVVYDRSVTLKKVYERFNGVCAICGKETDWSDNCYKFSGPRYPTIDHIIPLSLGGSHTWGNVQLACHKCNSVKGARTISLRDAS